MAHEDEAEQRCCKVCGEPIDGTARREYCSNSCRYKAWASENRVTLDALFCRAVKERLASQGVITDAESLRKIVSYAVGQYLGLNEMEIEESLKE